MRPAVGNSSPATTRRSVVLPEPDGPSSASNSPGRTSRSRSMMAGVAPKLLLSRSARIASAASGVVSRSVESGDGEVVSAAPFEDRLDGQGDKGESREKGSDGERRDEI